ncbi:cytochrome P450 4C1-like [Planococcus citri]|uniref:cytochrome P450 4C1-like n=1 Tax=Planococcus citri TaxID=170843 RepID=UPI0031F99F8B
MTITLLMLSMIIILSIIRYIIFKKSRKRLEKLVNEFAGPRAHPIIGNLSMFFGTPSDVLRRGLKIFLYKSPVRIWLLQKPMILIFDPENFQIVCRKTSDKEYGYGFIKDFLGEGLITASGEKWKKNRRLLNPAFNPHLLQDYFLNVFHEEDSKLIKTLDMQADKNIQFDLWPYIIHCTLNTITLTAINHRDEIEKGMFEYGDSILKASYLVTKRIYKPWLHPEFIYKLYKQIKGYNKAFDHIHGLPKTVIEKKKKEYENQNESNQNIELNDEENFSCDRKAKTFIDILLNCPESKKHFSNDELADEIVTIIMAGSETTAVSVCSTLVMLASHQHCQDKVYEEIENVLGDHEGNFEIKHLNKLTFLEQCIKETLRLFTTVPFIFRNVIEDIELKDGRIIPAGTTVCLSIAMLHINPQVYKNPRVWNPENFSAEEIVKRPYGSFLPFSTGPRSCIGAKYAMLSIKVMLVMLLRRYKFHTSMKMRDFHMGFDIVMRNTTGYHVRLEKRLP